MNADPKRNQTASVVVDILQILMALKDIYNDVSRRHNRGDKVRRRAVQLRSDLKAVLTASKSQPATDDESSTPKTGDQLPLPIEENAPERRVPKAFSPIEGSSKDPRRR
jgi:hypothetical protein